MDKLKYNAQEKAIVGKLLLNTIKINLFYFHNLMQFADSTIKMEKTKISVIKIIKANHFNISNKLYQTRKMTIFVGEMNLMYFNSK